ncbi:hypothetical protein TCAL_00881 [Tigriopus californicus]|uniref:Selenoprotein F n=1 Tax=Tigriopus californicus TaxID=6832 RepID=A0A553NEN7_TIGCA|nr:hypothetical protein TCAL_00881 [Tigriopus californicus]
MNPIGRYVMLAFLGSYGGVGVQSDSETDVDTPTQCASWGFDPSELLCSTCDDMSRFQLGSHLIQECQQCCHSDGRKLESVKYPKAILEVWAYPQVQAFIKSERTSRYPGLTIKYVRGADPTIKLLDEEEDVVETLAIDKWNTDSVEEFLDLYLDTAALTLEDDKATP